MFEWVVYVMFVIPLTLIYRVVKMVFAVKEYKKSQLAQLTQPEETKPDECG